MDGLAAREERSGKQPGRDIALRHGALHRPVAALPGCRADRHVRDAAREAGVGEQLSGGVEAARGQQVDLPGERQVGEERGGGARGRRHRASEERAVIPSSTSSSSSGSSTTCSTDILQHAAAQVAQPPRELAVIVISASAGSRHAGVAIGHGARQQPAGAEAGREDLASAAGTGPAQSRSRSGVSTTSCAAAAPAVTRTTRLCGVPKPARCTRTRVLARRQLRQRAAALRVGGAGQRAAANGGDDGAGHRRAGRVAHQAGDGPGAQRGCLLHRGRAPSTRRPDGLCVRAHPAGKNDHRRREDDRLCVWSWRVPSEHPGAACSRTRWTPPIVPPPRRSRPA